MKPLLNHHCHCHCHCHTSAMALKNMLTPLASLANDSQQDGALQKPTTPKKRVPKALRELQEQLTPQMMEPTTRRRSPRTRQMAHQQSPSKKRKIETQSSMASPPSSPQQSKIVKPTFSLTDMIKQEAAADLSPKKTASASKKLYFSDSKQQLVSVSPPVTPVKNEKHKQTFLSDINPKKLDLQEDTENISPIKQENTPPSTPTKPKSIYALAKGVFQRSFNKHQSFTLPQRDSEAEALREFILDNIIQQKSTSLYVSGPPGTGKTAQIRLTLSHFIDMDSSASVQDVEIDNAHYKIGYTYINCMSISKISNVFLDILRQFTGGLVSLKESKEALLKLLSDDKFAQMNIIVLDELDKLITADQQILFELFSWTILKDTNLILIGISNSLDMVDRLLPRLKMNGLNPNTLAFLPYTAEQIAEILKSRLRMLNDDPEDPFVPLFHPAAIQLCSKRSASNTGDLRKAFDICRSAIEIVEKEVRGFEVLSNYENGCSKILQYNLKTAPLVKINHVAKVCSNVFNQNQSSKLNNLNFQQKLLICMLIKADFENKTGNLTVNSFYEYYIKNADVDSLVGVLNKGEFLEVLTALESLGVIKISRSSKRYAESKISPSIIKKDLAAAVKSIPLLQTLLEGVPTN